MIIACDTSSVICSVAAADQGLTVFKREAVGGQIHIEKLTPFLKDALAFCNAQKKPPVALAIAIGPGSFNGLRIGLATMKGLAVALNLPVIPIPSTDAMAFGLRDKLTGNCRAIIFSHRNFVHFADYTIVANQSIITPKFSYAPWDELFTTGIDHFFGNADRGFGGWLHSEQGSQIESKFHQVEADAAHLALLAETRMDRALMSLDDLEPLYNAKFEAKKWVPPEF
ncbi:MAG: tRNA (adenosine(37)-N6)-threonylcarbamoyltransferase complex dimerization subunit type 1 TsaB [Candidatus Marinimicrobia bacterium]|nr:tRNA (adenosine(37)-N6)-threonylcarbamoyltransferase complex dimerization subunit type 1 TsaB [Candidatus Neomarinimicrobiota bacterium]